MGVLGYPFRPEEYTMRIPADAKTGFLWVAGALLALWLFSKVQGRIG